MKTIQLLVFLLLTGITVAQQDAQYTQYMYNTIAVNPAYAGSREALNILALHRTQWVGLDGAPTSTTFSLNTPIIYTNVGLGISFVNDRIGPSDENNIAIDFAYRIDTSEEFSLSFGLKASANLLSVDFDKLNQYGANDFSFETNIDNKFSPNIGLGLYWHSNKTYIGISVPNILETKHFNKFANSASSSILAKENINYYFIAGQVFDLNYYWKFKPALMTKLVEGAPLQVDLSANFYFNEKFTFGASYRWNAAASLLAGFQVSESWFIGYAYDLDTTKFANYNSGSHEFFLRYEMPNTYKKKRSRRCYCM